MRVLLAVSGIMAVIFTVAIVVILSMTSVIEMVQLFFGLWLMSFVHIFVIIMLRGGVNWRSYPEHERKGYSEFHVQD